MERFQEQIQAQGSVRLQLNQQLLKLRTEITQAEEVIKHHEQVIGHILNAIEINDRVRSHYNYLSVQDNDERSKLLRCDLDELDRLSDVLKQLM